MKVNVILYSFLNRIFTVWIQDYLVVTSIVKLNTVKSIKWTKSDVIVHLYLGSQYTNPGYVHQ